MTIPNILTLVRLVLVPFFAVIYMSDLPYAGLFAAIIFVVAALTDVVDGYIARKFNQISKLGRILDPLADKLLQITALACLVLKGIMHWLPFIVFATKELLLIIGGYTMASKINDVMPSNIFGKVASACMICAIGFAMVFCDMVGLKTVRIVVNCAIALAIVALVIYIIVGIKYIAEVRRKAS